MVKKNVDCWLCNVLVHRRFAININNLRLCIVRIGGMWKSTLAHVNYETMVEIDLATLVTYHILL